MLASTVQFSSYGRHHPTPGAGPHEGDQYTDRMTRNHQHPHPGTPAAQKEQTPTPAPSGPNSVPRPPPDTPDAFPTTTPKSRDRTNARRTHATTN